MENIPLAPLSTPTIATPESVGVEEPPAKWTISALHILAAVLTILLTPLVFLMSGFASDSGSTFAMVFSTTLLIVTCIAPIVVIVCVLRSPKELAMKYRYAKWAFIASITPTGLIFAVLFWWLIVPAALLIYFFKRFRKVK